MKYTHSKNIRYLSALMLIIFIIGTIIVENNKNGYYLAHTKNYILCYISSNEKIEHNKKLFVKLTEAFEDGAKAEIVQM